MLVKYWNVLELIFDIVGELKVKLYEVEEAVNRPGPKKISDEKDWAVRCI